MDNVTKVITDLKWRWSPLQIMILEERLAEYRMPEYELKTLLASHYNTTPKVDQVFNFIKSKFPQGEMETPELDEKRYSVIQFGNMKHYLVMMQEQSRPIYTFAQIPMACTNLVTADKVRKHIIELAKLRYDEPFLFEVGFFMLALSVSKTDGVKIPIAEFDPVDYFKVEKHPGIRVERMEWLLNSVTKILE